MATLTCVKTRETINLTNKLADSGEGAVWVTDQTSKLAKLYHQVTPERLEKLETMLVYPPVDPKLAPNHITYAWPESLLRNKQGKIVGFLMPRIVGASELIQVYTPLKRKELKLAIDWHYLHVVAYNLALAVHNLHEEGYVLGDIKAQNILVNSRGLVSIIDTDSFQVRHPLTGKLHHCLVGSPDYTPPDLLGKDFSQTEQNRSHDRFRLGVIFYQLLFGVHPFADGKWLGNDDPPELQDCLRRGLWPYSGDAHLKPGDYTIPLDIVDPSLKACFLACFNDGHRDPQRRPTAEQWKNALSRAVRQLVVCPSVESHIYAQHAGKCYWCERSTQLGTDIFAWAPGQKRNKNLPKPPSFQLVQMSARYTGPTRFALPNKAGFLRFVVVPGGTLTMENGYKVNLQTFLMGKDPLTQCQYQAVMGKNPSGFIGDLDRPVEQVTWHDAMQFCQTLSKMLNQAIDLPSETQWEWAARGSIGSKNYLYSGSNNPDDVAWSSSNSRRTSHPVEQKQLNELGLYDMSGNVWEWCKDNWTDIIDLLPEDGSALRSERDSEFNFKAARGGSWCNDSWDANLANRTKFNWSTKENNIGFRVVLLPYLYLTPEQLQLEHQKINLNSNSFSSISKPLLKPHFPSFNSGTTVKRIGFNSIPWAILLTCGLLYVIAGFIAGFNEWLVLWSGIVSLGVALVLSIVGSFWIGGEIWSIAGAIASATTWAVGMARTEIWTVFGENSTRDEFLDFNVASLFLISLIGCGAIAVAVPMLMMLFVTIRDAVKRFTIRNFVKEVIIFIFIAPLSIMTLGFFGAIFVGGFLILILPVFLGIIIAFPLAFVGAVAWPLTTASRMLAVELKCTRFQILWILAWISTIGLTLGWFLYKILELFDLNI